MTPEHALRTVIEAAAANYQSALQTFAPWPSKSYRKNLVITERNLSFQFARAFTNSIGRSVAFMEQQFIDPKASPKRTLRLDVYAASPTLAVAMETKTFFDTTEAVGVLHDFHRVSCGSAQQQLWRHPAVQPTEIRGLVLVEAWHLTVRDWWLSGTASVSAREFDPTLTQSLDGYRTAGWTFSGIEIGEFAHPARPDNGAKQCCWWLYAFTPPQALHPLSAASAA